MRGHIRKRGSTYSIVVGIGYDENGKRRQKWYFGYKTKPEAEKALNLILAEIEKGEYLEPVNMKLSDFLDKWLSVYCKPHLAPKTYSSYDDTVRLYFKPLLGDIELKKIKPVMIQQYYNILKEKYNLSDTTVNYHHRLLREALDQAVKWQYISKNPCDLVEAPKRHKPNMSVWDIEDVKKAEEVFAGTPIFFHVMIAIYTGLREGEICGLKWEDIDFKEKICTVRRTAQRVDGNLIFKDPKTETSERAIMLPQSIVDLLKAEKKKQTENKMRLGSQYNQEFDGYISLWEDGHFNEPGFVSKKFHKILLEHPELPIICFHDLRHTHASLMLASGVDMKTISERLGHSQIGITMNPYTHLYEKQQRDAVEKFVKYLR